jgi:hypothetical protein
MRTEHKFWNKISHFLTDNYMGFRFKKRNYGTSAFSRQGCTRPGRQVARATKFFMVVPNIRGSSVWNLLHVTLLAPTVLRRLPDFW